MIKKQFFIIFSIISMLNLNCFSQEIIKQNVNFKSFKVGNQWGFKKENKIVIPASFDYITDFSENYALVKTNGKWGYIDTLGNWFIKPSFDKGQPFQNGVAYVENGKFIGLVESQKGNFILEPIYTNIIEDYDSYDLFIGEKKGYLWKTNILSEEIQIVPAKYDSIALSYDVLSCLKEDKMWDIYYNDKLIITNAAKDIISADYDYYTKLIRVLIDGKIGVYDLKNLLPENAWIVKPSYAWIDFINFPAYYLQNDDAEKRLILALHDKNPTDIDPDLFYTSENDDQITFAKIDGTIISDKKFNYIKTFFDDYLEIPNLFALELANGTKTTYLYPDFSIKEFPFTTLISHYYGSFSIANGDNCQYILDRNLAIIDSFYRVEQYKEYQNNPNGVYYDEYGNELYDDIYEEKVVQEPFLLVFRLNSDQVEEKAIYQLDEHKVISPWSISYQENQEIKRLDVNYQTLYIYRNNENAGYYIKGMDKGTDFKYSPDMTVYNLGKYFALFTNEEFNSQDYDSLDKKQDLFYYDNQKVNLISKDYKVSKASNYATEEYIYDPETGEENIKALQSFSEEFLILQNSNNKYGLISNNNLLIEPKFDTLLQNTSLTIMLDVTIDSLYGSIDLWTGNYIKPFSYYPFYFANDISVNNFPFSYATIYDEKLNETYFMDTKGSKFYCRPDLTFVKKVKRKYGLYGYSQIALDPYTEKMQVPAKYKKLQNSFMTGVFNAQGKNKKWGLINFMGDTIVPLKYTKIEPYYYNGDNNFSFITSIGKKKGIFDIVTGEKVACKYDEISTGDFFFGDFFLDVYLTSIDGKKGLITGQGQTIFPNELDEIMMEYADYGADTYIVGKKKNKKIAVSSNIISNFENFNYTKLVEYDFTVRSEGFVIKDKQFDIYSIATNSFVKTIKAEDLNLKGNLYRIVYQNGKFGAINSNEIQTVPCEYDFATFMQDRDDVMIGYQNGVKYYIYVDTNERYTEQQW